VNIKYHCLANGETGYHAHSKAFWSRLEKFNDNQGVPINIVLDCVNTPIFYKNYDGVKICYSVYESTLLPEEFFNHILKNWDYFWCPSEWQRQCTIDQGFPAERVHVVPEGVDGKEFFPVSDEDLADEFTFIIIGKWEYRKATEEMISAWLETFPLKDYPTGIKLVLSVDNMFNKEFVQNKLKQLESLKDPRIEILHFPPREEYIKRLRTSHVFLSCSRAEGWNLPLIEALACGVPSICTDYSAQVDYAKNIAFMVNMKEMKSVENFPGEYAEPDFEQFKYLMKNIAENWNECRQRALMGASFVRQAFSWEKAVEIAMNYLKEIEKTHKPEQIENAQIKGMNIGVSFMDGVRLEMSGNTGIEYDIKFIDKDTNNTVYQSKLRPVDPSVTCWSAPSARYFVNWKIEASSQSSAGGTTDDPDTIIIKGKGTSKEIFLQEYDAKGKRIFINLDSKALGDNIAWIPYVEAFRQKWDCHVIVTTFWNSIFNGVYPDLEFVNPGAIAHNLYAQYKIGCFDDDNTRNKDNWREIPMQKVASDILGMPYSEIRPKAFAKEFQRTGRKYVCISDHSTMQSKYWNYPGGWQEIVDYLGDLGYDVVAVSKDPTGLTKLVPINNKPIEETASIISGCEFFIGVGSGLSWLAWALNKKVIMVSGFSDPFTEFTIDNYRISPIPGACHGCFNDSKLKFDRSWDWCPRNKNYECSRTITPQVVKDKIDLLISHL
jgi:autotransporter strand-loop-strand O-heptosyltransferase